MVTLAIELAARGHTVEFFIYYPARDHFRIALERVGIVVHQSAKRHRYDLQIPLKLRRVLTRGRFDVSVSFLDTPNVYNLVANIGTSTLTVVSDGTAIPDGPLRFGKKVRYAMYQQADHVVVNSHHQHERMGLEVPRLKPKIHRISNGVNVDIFRPAEDRRPKSATGRNAILAVGSIQVGKNFLGLIEGLRAYRDEFGTPPLIRWAGREPTEPEDIDAYQHARVALRRYELEDSWEWLGIRGDIPELLSAHDAFIHPSLFEGLPNAVCEALATGTPVLVSDVCDHALLVEDGVRGFLFDPSNPQEISRAIRRFVTSTATQKVTMARNARAFAESMLSVRASADSYEALFAKPISSGKGSYHPRSASGSKSNIEVQRILLNTPSPAPQRSASYGDGYGGYVRMADVLERSFVSENFQLVPCYHSIRTSEHFEVLRLPLRLVRDVLVVIREAKDAAGLHMTLQYRRAIFREFAISAVVRWLGIPLLVDVRAGSFETWYSGAPALHQRMVGFILRTAKEVTVEGTSYIDFIKHEFGRSSTYLPNFVPDSEIPAQTSAKCTSDPLRILFVATPTRQRACWT